MGRDVVETIMGAVVLLVAAAFIMIAYQSGNVSGASNGYKVTAKFKQIGAVSIGSDVRIGGIKIGSVANQYLDNKSYLAVVELNVRGDIELPKDSSAAVVSESLLGGKYIELEPGADEALLKNGDEIKYTQDAVNFEQLIGKFAFGGVSDQTKTEADDSSAPSLGL